MKPPEFHTPYDGSSKPFTIGLKPLDLVEWIEYDNLLSAYIAEKQRLYAEMPDKVLVAEPGTESAQQEVLDVLHAHLLQSFPKIYSTLQKSNSPQLGPLARAALMVQEDLVLMRKSAEGWRLVAASLCFPSSWNLLEKFKRPLHQIHAPVPNFGEGTRNASLIERIFDNLQVDQPVLRWNWSLMGDMELHHPHFHSGRFGAGDLAGNVTLRLERQTLRKMPISGDILFTIRIHLDPLEVLQRQPNGRELAMAIDAQLSALSLSETEYKGLIDERQRLSVRLKQIGTRQ